MLEVCVSDSGPGLPAGLEQRVFDPFFTTKSTGMGVGLSICRTIIEAHGGKIWVDPGAGAGTAFRFTLPLEPGPGAS
jgi:signal transduction histidine kinase